MIRADGRHYLVSRRHIHAAIASMLVLVVLVGASAFVLADRWLPEVERVLDAEAPLANPDAVVVGSSGRSVAADRAAAELIRSGAQAVVLSGRPFAPDDLAPAERSRRYASLTAQGIPRERIVELYDSIDLWEALDELAAAAHDRGWRRVLMLDGPGGSRRTLLAAQSVLTSQGIEVGLVLYPDDGAGLEPLWWTDGQLRGHVLYNWILLVFGRLVGRY